MFLSWVFRSKKQRFKIVIPHTAWTTSLNLSTPTASPIYKCHHQFNLSNLVTIWGISPPRQKSDFFLQSNTHCKGKSQRGNPLS